jgi:hypothetical protein
MDGPNHEKNENADGLRGSRKLLRPDRWLAVRTSVRRSQADTIQNLVEHFAFMLSYTVLMMGAVFDVPASRAGTPSPFSLPIDHEQRSIYPGCPTVVLISRSLLLLGLLRSL